MGKIIDKKTEKLFRYQTYLTMGMSKEIAMVKAGISAADLEGIADNIAEEISLQVVEHTIKLKVVDAMQAIIKELDSKHGKQRLLAAQDILDRAGIVKKQKIEKQSLNVNMSDAELDRLIELKKKQLERMSGGK